MVMHEDFKFVLRCDQFSKRNAKDPNPVLHFGTHGSDEKPWEVTFTYKSHKCLPCVTHVSYKGRYKIDISNGSLESNDGKQICACHHPYHQRPIIGFRQALRATDYSVTIQHIVIDSNQDEESRVSSPSSRSSPVASSRSSPTLSDLSMHYRDLFFSAVYSDIIFEVSSSCADSPSISENRQESFSISVKSEREKDAVKREVSVVNQGSANDDTEKVSYVEIRAHKAILSSRVPYFKQLLLSGMNEATTGRIRIEDVEAESFREVVKFIYCGQLPGDLATNPVKYLPIADKYGIDDLKGMNS